MQTEEMKRLFKEGKRVGYKWEVMHVSMISTNLGHGDITKNITSINERIITWYNKNRNDNIVGENCGWSLEPIEYDSFEQGIKAEDGEWIFGEFIRNNQKKSDIFGLFRFQESKTK